MGEGSEKTLYGVTVQKNAIYGITAVLATGVIDDIEVIIHGDKLFNALRGFSGEDFTIEFEGEDLIINTHMSVRLQVYDEGKSHSTLADTMNEEPIFNQLDAITKSDLDLVNEYFPFISKPQEKFANIYIKKRMTVTNRAVVRYSKREFDFPYTITVNNYNRKALMSMEAINVACYSRVVKFYDNSGNSFVMMRDVDAETQYENFLSEVMDLGEVPEFSFDKEKLLEGFKFLKPFLNKGKLQVRIDIANNKLSVKGDYDIHEADFPLEITTQGDYTYKNVNPNQFTLLVRRCEDVVTLSGGTLPFDSTGLGAFLRLENDLETIFISPIQD
jgi:hypothetical protein